MSQQQAPQLLSVSSHLQIAVEQQIDALCFSGTHALDSDLRCQPKAGLSSINRLVDEQRRREEELFGPGNVSAESLAIQLDELFRVDATSITEVEPGVMGSPVVDAMTDTTAKIFKKEMKQRIHEWEGAFRAAHGREPNAQDKNRLRHIYELYRTVKSRVLKGPPETAAPAVVAAPATVAATGAAPIVSSQQQQQQSFSGGAGYPLALSQDGAAGLSRPSAGGVAPRSSSATSVSSVSSTPLRQGGGSTGAPSPHMTPYQQQPQSQIASGTPSAALNVQLTPMNNNNSNPNSGRGPSQSQSRAPTPTGSGSSAAVSSLVPSAAAASSAPAGLDALAAEKRNLKRKLHAFEADFQRQHGRPPTRDDRMPLLAEYQRYGELKMALQQHQGGGDD